MRPPPAVNYQAQIFHLDLLRYCDALYVNVGVGKSALPRSVEVHGFSLMQRHFEA